MDCEDLIRKLAAFKISSARTKSSVEKLLRHIRETENEATEIKRETEKIRRQTEDARRIVRRNHPKLFEIDARDGRHLSRQLSEVQTLLTRIQDRSSHHTTNDISQSFKTRFSPSEDYSAVSSSTSSSSSSIVKRKPVVRKKANSTSSTKYIKKLALKNQVQSEEVTKAIIEATPILQNTQIIEQIDKDIPFLTKADPIESPIIQTPQVKESKEEIFESHNKETEEEDTEGETSSSSSEEDKSSSNESSSSVKLVIAPSKPSNMSLQRAISSTTSYNDETSPKKDIRPMKITSTKNQFTLEDSESHKDLISGPDEADEDDDDDFWN